MAAAQIIPELFYTIILVIYYCLEAVVLSVVPNRMRARKPLNREVAVVTGGGHGIGRAVAIKLARQGCTVIILDKNEVWMEESRQIIANEGGRVFAYLCDVSKKEAVYECAKRIELDVGDVSILVNNAGVVSVKNFTDMPDESVEEVFHTNTFAHFWTLKAFLPYMLDQNHGHIVTIASVVGKGAGGRAAGYVASKFAAVGLHEALEMELRALRRTGIQLTLVCPGLVDTGLFAGAEYRFPKLVPKLDADQLAEDIVGAMQRNEHLIIAPFAAQLGVRAKYLLPQKAFNVMTEFAGAATMLDNFHGRDVESQRC